AARSSKELLGSEVTQPKEVPLRSLVLPTMPVQEMGEEPPRLLFFSTLGTVGGNTGGERFHQRSNPSSAFINRGRRRAISGRWAPGGGMPKGSRRDCSLRRRHAPRL